MFSVINIYIKGKNKLELSSWTFHISSISINQTS